LASTTRRARTPAAHRRARRNKQDHADTRTWTCHLPPGRGSPRQGDRAMRGRRSEDTNNGWLRNGWALFLYAVLHRTRTMNEKAAARAKFGMCRPRSSLLGWRSATRRPPIPGAQGRRMRMRSAGRPSGRSRPPPDCTSKGNVNRAGEASTTSDQLAGCEDRDENLKGHELVLLGR